MTTQRALYLSVILFSFFFFFNDTATTEIYPLSLHDALPISQAAFVEPVSCVIHALNRLRVWPGDEVLIFGAGPMGLLLVQALRHSGASQINVVEKEQERRDLALRMGATTAIAANSDFEKMLFDLAPYGYGIVIDAR